MIQDKLQFLSTMTTRQKVTAGVFALIMIIVIWQVIGLFGGGDEPVSSSTMVSAPPPQQLTPQLAPLPQSAVSQREKELLQQQQFIEAKYIAALNELQMLKLEREIAETNKAIIDARLGMVTAQKSIVNLLSPPPPPQVTQGAYAQGLVGGAITPTPTAAIESSPQSEPQQSGAARQTQEGNYMVVSISQLKYKWSAVLGYQTNLYHVFVGDVLPPDGSTVISINRSGVVLEKNGVKKKISLVPII
ncbi:MAG TPA: hypothetical protein VJN02_08960 [Gammaproteobacteria bacterium]|nr:hypothetical protein [Gammaproteobacteria bacterium]